MHGRETMPPTGSHFRSGWIRKTIRDVRDSCMSAGQVSLKRLSPAEFKASLKCKHRHHCWRALISVSTVRDIDDVQDFCTETSMHLICLDSDLSFWQAVPILGHTSSFWNRGGSCISLKAHCGSHLEMELQNNSQILLDGATTTFARRYSATAFS